MTVMAVSVLFWITGAVCWALFAVMLLWQLCITARRCARARRRACDDVMAVADAVAEEPLMWAERMIPTRLHILAECVSEDGQEHSR